MYLSMTTSVHIPQCSRRENETKQKKREFHKLPYQEVVKPGTNKIRLILEIPLLFLDPKFLKFHFLKINSFLSSNILLLGL